MRWCGCGLGVSVASRRCPGGGRPHSAARQGRNDGGGNTRRRESWAAGLGRGERGAVTVLTERVSACAIKFLIGHSETASQLCHHFHARRSGVGRWRRTRHIYTHTNNQTASCHTRLCHVLLLLLFILHFPTLPLLTTGHGTAAAPYSSESGKRANLIVPHDPSAAS